MSEAATKADAELAGLRSLLDEHQELGRLNTMLSGYSRKTHP
jgi:hypothetical protein